MIAVFGGIGAAVAWALGTMCATRSSRIVGASATVGWGMLAGLVVVAPWLAGTGIPQVDAQTWLWVAIGGAGNVGGLLLTYYALKTGQVGVVAPIVSAEGGVAAVIAVVAGASLGGLEAAALVLVIIGVVLTSGAGRPHGGPVEARAARRAGAAALTFGVSLYATGRASSLVPLAWAVAPPRVVGVAVVTLPLLARRGLPRSREALPFAVLAGACEVVGFVAFSVGSRRDIVVTVVLASLTGAVAAGFARLTLKERLRRPQLVGVAAIVAGVATVSALSA